MSNAMTDAILLRSLVLFLMVGSVAGLMAGLMMLLRPEWLARISQFSNSWVSTRKMAKPLDQKINIDHWFYRYGHLSGAVLLIGSIYIVYMLTVKVTRNELLVFLTNMHWVHSVYTSLLLDTLALLMLSAAMLGLILGLFLLLRPSMLRELEQEANQRMTLRRALKPVEIQHAHLDRLVFSHIQLAGLLLLCGSLYALVALGLWLAR